MASQGDDADRLTRVARATTRIAGSAGLDTRLRAALEELDSCFGLAHTMVFVPEGESRLVLLGCRGYPQGGVGAEVRFGEGPIGVAAARRVAVGIAHVAQSFRLMRSVQARMDVPARTIQLPGLVDVASEVAVPAVVDGDLALVLYAEDAHPGRFSPHDGEVLQIVANQLAAHLRSVPDDDAAPESVSAVASGPDALVVDYYESDSSVFFGGEYVIKSLPGRILRRLVREHIASGRTEFTKKELRLDPELQLPQIRDNLDTRLILLARRLEERFPFVSLERTERGKFRLRVESAVELREHP